MEQCNIVDAFGDGTAFKCTTHHIYTQADGTCVVSNPPKKWPGTYRLLERNVYPDGRATYRFRKAIGASLGGGSTTVSMPVDRFWGREYPETKVG